MFYFYREPKWQEELIRQLAKEYGLDRRVVRGIVYYPLKYTSEFIKDDVDEVPIRHRNFGLFAIRPHLKKSRKYNKTKQN